ncbi:MAG: OPT/YSL family transporter [Nitrososphaerota archaeon]|nr:OPT/YSL family transporter [Candidatus Bathyarchaeota archaeon]MDW8049083.1 OPT/YSL family transporter [Nitrososphaerota archaeon]
MSDKWVLHNIDKFESGLTWRSILAMLYCLFVITPATLWMNLVIVGGEGFGGVVGLFLLLIFTEYSRFSSKRLTPQEATLIFGPAAIAGSGLFITLIYRAYFMQSPLPKLFNIPIEEIPSWWAPQPTFDALRARTFFTPEWQLPILVAVVADIAGYLGAFFFGLLLRELYIENERLPFPIQQIRAVAIVTLVEREEKRMEVLSWSFLVSFLYGMVLHILPTVTLALGKEARVIPLPWIDYYKIIEPVLPGGAFGLATSLIILAQGIMLPPIIVICIFAGSILRFLIINPLLVKMGWTEWANYYMGGMDITKIYQYSTLYYWLNPLIGVGLALGFVPLLLRIRTLAHQVKDILTGKISADADRISGERFPGWFMAVLFGGGILLPIIIDYLLVPEFPVWGLILYEFIFPLAIGLMSGRMVGVTGQGATIPYTGQLTVLLSGMADKTAAWFLPLRLNTGVEILTELKVCQLTRTTASSFLKMNMLAYPLALLAGLIFTQMFWALAPIPSSLFPAPAISWPISIMNQCAWITRPERFFRIPDILTWLIGYGSLIVVLNFMNMPTLAVGLAAGLQTPIPIPVTMLIGLSAGKVLARISGEKWYGENRTSIAAGLMLGEGTAIIFAVAGGLAIKAIWASPF